MSIAIHSRQVCSVSLAFLEAIIDLSKTYQKRIIVSNHLAKLLESESTVNLSTLPVFDLSDLNLQLDLELIISLGGDGTFLETIHYLKDHVIPLLGIHRGNLGFLTMVTLTDAVSVLIRFFEGDYTLEERTLLALYGASTPVSFGLNEVALLKRD
ncbi:MULTISPECIES: NAD(+)/NADH kinase [Candidatus Cardinium]|uniref:NAD(+)/NADH kinase n=1 Tax=Candidatus Cardinium TaxID=273135 RepID=UPI001FAAD148|nr:MULTISPECIES: NAD(+)/NADH kinase [Cardinium]